MDVLKHLTPLGKGRRSPFPPIAGEELGFGFEGIAPLYPLPTLTSGPYLEPSL